MGAETMAASHPPATDLDVAPQSTCMKGGPIRLPVGLATQSSCDIWTFGIRALPVAWRIFTAPRTHSVPLLPRRRALSIVTS